MKCKRTLPVLIAVLVFAATAAQAGPPLICHAVDIGDAESLPGHDSDWRVYKTAYDADNLVADTLAILGPSTPVLVRMETIRRATVHGKKDPAVLGELLERLQERVDARDDSLALFDLGYFVETLKQFRWELKHRVAGTRLDGYEMVERAIVLGGREPAMEFAAAIITAHPRRSGHKQHLQAAVEGAREDSLLARNLVKHFGERGATFADLRASVSRD